MAHPEEESLLVGPNHKLVRALASPSTWAEFKERCEKRIAQIRDSKDEGHFASMYADDVEVLLFLLYDSHLDYDGNPDTSYRRLNR
jgi:hypothetical protein